jgi:ATP-binding cassette subfamily C protein LapB
LAPLAQIANLFGRANGAKNAYLRLSKFMEDTETKDLKGLVGRSNLGTLEFNSCCFRYPDKELDTLNKVNFKIHEGEKVGLLGRNGSGKSTLVKLACGLLYPTEGMATYDGVSIKQINSKDLAKSLGIVLQDVQLFSGSVRENIIMGRDNISDEDIVSAGKLSGLDDFIGKMPGGYDFQLLDRGKGLSGGQRQAIAISRGMVHKPTHLILDEPTSSMDLNAEKDFITKLSQTIGKSTVLLVSHRIPLLKILDRIIIIHEGLIVDDGPTDEILDKLNS